MKNSEQPAFTLEVYKDLNKGRGEPDYSHPTYKGLTKREYFAIETLKGILSNSAHNDLNLMGVNASPVGFIAANFAAKEAISYADELLKQLTKQ